MTTEQLFKGRGTSSNPPLCPGTSHSRKKQGVSSAAKGVQNQNRLLQAIGDHPGCDCSKLAQYASVLRRDAWRILREYEEDEVIYQIDGLWYLEAI